MNGTVAEERGDQSPEEWKLRLMQAKALGNTEVREYIYITIVQRSENTFIYSNCCTEVKEYYTFICIVSEVLYRGQSENTLTIYAVSECYTEVREYIYCKNYCTEVREYINMQ